MEVTMPEFPADTMARLVYSAPLVTLLVGLMLMLVPRIYATIFGVVDRPGRYGGKGEIRVAGGFIFGLSLAAFLFQDQPEIPVTLGLALLGGAFGRILAMMSDHAGGLVNFVALLIQAGLAGILLTLTFEVFTPETSFSMPTDPAAVLSFWSAAALAVVGFVVMFAPRLAFMAVGLDPVEGHEAAIAGARSMGGIALATGGMVMLNGSVMLLLAYSGALSGALAGRVVSLVFNRGNWIVQAISAVVLLAMLVPPLNYVFGMM